MIIDPTYQKASMPQTRDCSDGSDARQRRRSQKKSWTRLRRTGTVTWVRFGPTPGWGYVVVAVAFLCCGVSGFCGVRSCLAYACLLVSFHLPCWVAAFRVSRGVERG